MELYFLESIEGNLNWVPIFDNKLQEMHLMIAIHYHEVFIRKLALRIKQYLHDTKRFIIWVL